MVKRLNLAITMAILCLHVHAQVTPRDHALVNYRIIGFTFPPVSGATSYNLQVADGDCHTDEDFDHRILKSVQFTTNKGMVEVPEFAHRYTWRVITSRNHMLLKKGRLHSFDVGTSADVDSNERRLRIVTPATKYKDYYVFVDGSRSLYDLKGNPVWYLPPSGPFADINSELRDLKMTPFGTITFLVKDGAYEVNWDGQVLWKAPNTGQVSGGKSENYHHQFTHLANGHYMVMGQEYRAWTVNKDSTISWRQADEKDVDKLEASTLIEYDEHGNVVWSWHSAGYYETTRLYRHRIPHRGEEIYSTHANGFYFDEKKGYVYVSFKNTSQVLKVKYPEGDVVAAYGQLEKLKDDGHNELKSNLPDTGERLFCDQHACHISKEGYLYLYDNNDCEIESTPKAIVLRETGGDKLQTVWEYRYPVQDTTPETLHGGRITNGGNVSFLPGGDMFVAMANPYTNIFIVSHDKHLLWDAILEHVMPRGMGWMRQDSYRASIIDPKQLQRLLWHDSVPQ